MAIRRNVPFWDYGLAGYLPGASVSKKKTTGTVSGEVSMKFLVDKIPAVRAMETGPVKLPAVTAPSLDDLAVSVPKPDDFTQDDLLRRFHELVRAQATLRERAAGEQLAMGDDVRIDTLAYSGGELVPFSARGGLWMELAPQEALPGFAEAIALGKVGATLDMKVTLPASYPVAALRNQSARFLVDIREAREVKMPDEESPELLKKLGRGATLDEVMLKISDELEDELAGLLWEQAREMVFDELLKRAKPELTKTLVDEEIRRRWGQTEARFLLEKNFTPDEQKGALDGWLKDPATRADAERRLKVALVLKAVAERDKLTLTPAKLEELVTNAGESFGLSAADARAGLRESKALTEQMTAVGWHLLAVEHVMSKAKVTFET